MLYPRLYNLVVIRLRSRTGVAVLIISINEMEIRDIIVDMSYFNGDR